MLIGKCELVCADVPTNRPTRNGRVKMKMTITSLITCEISQARLKCVRQSEPSVTMTRVMMARKDHEPSRMVNKTTARHFHSHNKMHR